MPTYSKVALAVSIVVASTGFLTTVVFTVLAGLDYRAQEDLGLQPGYTPPWIVIGIESGLAILAIGVFATVVVGIHAAIVARRQRSSR